jgi:hypothetical protein
VAQAGEASLDRSEELRRTPEFLVIRECRVLFEQPGFRIRTLIVATTLLDAAAFARDDLAQLYRARWNAELDLRSLKETLQMDVVRCKTPALVRKELWTHILANLIRTIAAQAATKHGIEPRAISFKRVVQTLEAFRPVIALQGERGPAFRKTLYGHVLDAIAIHRVADRPDRYEPRRRKRRPKPYDRLMQPRWMANAICATDFGKTKCHSCVGPIRRKPLGLMAQSRAVRVIRHLFLGRQAALRVAENSPSCPTLGSQCSGDWQRHYGE